MTDKAETQVLTELAKAGVLFLVLGIAIWALWNNQQRNDEEQRQRIKALEEKTSECQQENHKIIMEQLKLSIETIDRNTRVIESIGK